MSKHTPGPWKAVCRHVSYRGGEWPEDEFLQWEVDGPRVPMGRGDFFQADARLIAAAPDLLEALEAVARVISVMDSPITEISILPLEVGKQVAAAITKAKGES